jgi:glycosyltransferase involved in cell wall biosynthesis
MELATRALLEELRHAGIRYERVDTADPDDDLANRGRLSLHNLRLAMRHAALAAWKLRRKEVAVVYVPIAQEFPALFRDMVFITIARLARRPVVLHLHGGMFRDFYSRQTPILKWMTRATVGRATVGIVLTERLRPALECVVPADRVVCVANGVSPAPAAIGRVDDRVHVMFLSSLFPWKGTHLFIEAFARATEGRSDVIGTLAGTWPSAEVRERTLAFADSLGIRDRLTFPGVVDLDEKRRLMGTADIFCFTSLVPEGQPLVILEAMAAGLPVVAFDWPGIADTVLEGETGVLLEDRSSDAVADALRVLIEDAAERRRLGEAGRARYELLYTQEAFGRRVIGVLRPLLGGPVARNEDQAIEATR